MLSEAPYVAASREIWTSATVSSRVASQPLSLCES